MAKKRELRKLQKEWYQRLKDEGFEDIEKSEFQLTEGVPTRKSSREETTVHLSRVDPQGRVSPVDSNTRNSNQTVNPRVTQTEIEDSLEYYSRCTDLVHREGFPWEIPSDQILWDVYSRGGTLEDVKWIFDAVRELNRTTNRRSGLTRLDKLDILSTYTMKVMPKHTLPTIRAKIDRYRDLILSKDIK